MGRFNHEAAAVDPNTGYVYMTEDRDDSLLYRFIPTQAANLAGGGRLQAMAMATGTLTDTRNRSGTNVIVGQWSDIRWIDLDNPQSPTDDLRVRGLALGALRFARGEGIYFGLGELFFTSTSGGAAGMGQVFRISPSVTGGRLQLFFESSAASQYSFGDNIVVAPDGQLIVCEDQGTSPVDNFLRGLNQTGQVYPLARLRIQTETAGACFSPDGRHMFLNIYSPTKTVAITGPWAHLRP
jgi:uncharacterized repeat protein (TIGR03803 family)